MSFWKKKPKETEEETRLVPITLHCLIIYIEGITDRLVLSTKEQDKGDKLFIELEKHVKTNRPFIFQFTSRGDRSYFLDIGRTDKIFEGIIPFPQKILFVEKRIERAYEEEKE